MEKLRAFLADPTGYIAYKQVKSHEEHEGGPVRLADVVRQHIQAVAAALGVLLLIVAVGIADGGRERALAVSVPPTTSYLDLDTQSFADTGKVTLTGAQDLAREWVENHLTIKPDVAFSVSEPTPAGDFAIYLYGNRNEAYTLTLERPDQERAASWSFGQPELLEAALIKRAVTQGESVYINFSHRVDKEELLDNLSILPEVSYNVTLSGSVAEISLRDSDRIGSFTVRLGASLRSADGVKIGGYTELDFTVKEKAAPATPKFAVNLTNRFVVINASDRPIPLEFDTENNNLPEVPAIITTYRFDSIDKYSTQATKIALYNVDPSLLLEKVGTDIHILTKGVSRIELENPGEGGYLIQVQYEHPVTKEPQVIQKHVMVTDLSVYMQSTNGQLLLWANSSSTGLAAGGYTVDFLNLAGTEVLTTAVTDETGVAVFEDETPIRSGFMLRLRDPEGNTAYVDKTDAVEIRDYNQPIGGRYFSYFYLDRSIYKPRDEIQFWGCIRPYEGNEGPDPTEVRIVLDPAGLGQSVTAELDANGIFHGSLTLDQIKSSNYTVAMVLPLAEPVPSRRDEDVMVSEITLDSYYIEVKEYQKPMFQISAEADKKLYGYDEDVTLTVTPTFYDGTPMPNYELELVVYDGYYGDAVTTEPFMTNDDGVATVKFPAYQMKSMEIPWRTVQNRYQVRISSDGENIVHTGSYTYFPTDVAVSAQVEEQEDETLRLAVQATGLDASRVTTDQQLEELRTLGRYSYSGDCRDYSREEFDYLRHRPYEGEVSVSVKLEYYLSGGKSKTEQISVEQTPTDGVLYVPITFPEEMDRTRSHYAYATVSAKDSRGRVVTYNTRYSSYKHSSGDDEEKPQFPAGYSFAVTDAAGESLLEPYVQYMSYHDARVGAGENMTFTLLLDGEPVPNTGRILYTIIQDGILDRGMSSADALTFTQSVRWANNVNLVAAYFDGSHVHPIYDTMIRLDRESVRLNVEATPTQTSYAPGDTVTLNVKVTDQKGNGVAGNSVVSVVDESVFALREQNVTVLDTFFGGMSFYIYVSKYTTLTSRGVPEYTGKGDVGKADPENLAFYDMYRKNFKDTAAFLPIRTDAGGNATVTFQLPDNNTSWRVTTVSIGDNYYAGNGRTNFASSLPFFVSPVISSKYIEGDDVAMLVQGHGTLLDKESEISYIVRITGDGVDETKTLQNTAYQSNMVNFGKLPTGEYTVVATARYSGYSDTVEIPLAVVSSNLELVIHREVDLSEGLDQLDVVRYPVTLTFYDREYQAYYRSISSLLTHYCMIANQRMSRFVAKRALTQYMDPLEIPQHILADDNDYASDMQNSDGGIGWAVGDPSEILLTTQVLLIAGDQFNHNTMANYYRGILERGGGYTPTGEEIASCYLGLAYLGEPVEDLVLGMVQNEKIPLLEKAYLIAALAYGGNTAEAERQYKTHIDPYMVRSGDKAHIKTEGGEGDDDRITRTVWLAASKIGHADADGIAMYFATSTWRIDSLFECMAYVTNYDKAVTPYEYSYSVDGVTHTGNLGVKGAETIVLSRSEAESFRMGNAPEGLHATAYFIGEPSEADFDQSDQVAVRKEITPVENGRYQVDVILTLAADAPQGQYDVSDWIPSNMRFYNIDRKNASYDSDRGWYYTHKTEGQKLYFTVRNYRDAGEEREIKLTYFIQRTYDAEAVMDSTYVIHGNSGESNFSPRYTWKGPDAGTANPSPQNG